MKENNGKTWLVLRSRIIEEIAFTMSPEKNANKEASTIGRYVCATVTQFLTLILHSLKDSLFLHVYVIEDT